MPAAEVLHLALFSAAVLAATLYGLTASGHFPAEHRLPALRTPLGSAVLWGSILVAGAAIAFAVKSAIHGLHWPHVVISAGAAALLAPLVLQWFSDAFVDGLVGLIVFAAATLAFTLAATAIGG